MKKIRKGIDENNFKILNLKQASELFGVLPVTLKKMIDLNPNIPHKKFGKKMLFLESELKAWWSKND